MFVNLFNIILIIGQIDFSYNITLCLRKLRLTVNSTIAAAPSLKLLRKRTPTYNTIKFSASCGIFVERFYTQFFLRTPPAGFLLGAKVLFFPGKIFVLWTIFNLFSLPKKVEPKSLGLYTASLKTSSAFHCSHPNSPRCYQIFAKQKFDSWAHPPVGGKQRSIPLVFYTSSVRATLQIGVLFNIISSIMKAVSSHNSLTFVNVCNTILPTVSNEYLCFLFLVIIPVSYNSDMSFPNRIQVIAELSLNRKRCRIFVNDVFRLRLVLLYSIRMQLAMFQILLNKSYN